MVAMRYNPATDSETDFDAEHAFISPVARVLSMTLARKSSKRAPARASKRSTARTPARTPERGRALARAAYGACRSQGYDHAPCLNYTSRVLTANGYAIQERAAAPQRRGDRLEAFVNGRVGLDG
jgi:hypothetical protein